MAFMECAAVVREDGSLFVAEQDRQQLNLHPGDAVTLRIVTLEDAPPKISKPRKQSEAAQARWEQQRQQLTEELGKVWPAGISAAEIVSEMRR